MRSCPRTVTMIRRVPYSPMSWLAFLHTLSVLTLPSHSTLHYSMPEQREPGFLVADLLTDARLTENFTLPSSVTSELQLAILPGRHAGLFAVDARVGTLRTSSQAIDREELCTDQVLIFYYCFIILYEKL